MYFQNTIRLVLAAILVIAVTATAGVTPTHSVQAAETTHQIFLPLVTKDCVHVQAVVRLFVTLYPGCGDTVAVTILYGDGDLSQPLPDFTYFFNEKDVGVWIVNPSIVNRMNVGFILRQTIVVEVRLQDNSIVGTYVFQPDNK